MKKTKEQIIEHLKGLLEEERVYSKEISGLFIILFLIYVIVTISLYNMDDKFNKQKHIIKLHERERQLNELTYKCSKLSEISKKQFSIVTEGLSGKETCNHGYVFLYTVKEIDDAIRHYELGVISK